MTNLIGRLFDQLHRRRVFQSAALYVAVAWGGTEILVFLVDALFGESPAKDARRYLAILLIAGFPAAMYLAWTRDLGLKGRRLFGAGVALVAVVALLVYWIPDDRTISMIDRSIAVLPFDVCEERQSDRPLARQLAAAIQGRLSERQNISVIGSQSVQAAVATGPPIPVIADLLGVKFLLSGVVCREGRDPTISIELLDDRGVVVWDNRFREVANDYDQVEVQLAELVDKGVARQFGDASTGKESGAIAREALVQLRLGDGFWAEREFDKARAAYEKALEIQPGYAEALYGLAILSFSQGNSESNLENFAAVEEAFIDFTKKAMDAARAAVERDPRDFQANWLAGQILHDLAHVTEGGDYREMLAKGEEGVADSRAQSARRYVEAQRYLDAALAIRPDDSAVRIYTAHNMGFLGVDSRRASLDVLEQGLVSDPFNSELVKRLVPRMVEFGEVNRAMDVLDAFDQLPQGNGKPWFMQHLVLARLGLYDRALTYYVELLRRSQDGRELRPIGVIWVAGQASCAFAELGLYEEAEDVYALIDPIEWDPAWWRRHLQIEAPYLYATGQVEEAGRPVLDKLEGLSNTQILDSLDEIAVRYAEVLWESGDKERAIEIVEVVAQARVSPTALSGDQMRLPRLLADMYLGVGRNADAMAVLDRIIARLEEEKLAGVRHPKSLMTLATSYADQGRRDEAIEALHLAIDYGAWDMSICCRDYLSEAVLEMLAGDGFPDSWESFEGDPEFELAKTRMRSIVDAQRANIRALLKQNDLAELISPWIEDDEEPAASAN